MVVSIDQATVLDTASEIKVTNPEPERPSVTVNGILYDLKPMAALAGIQAVITLKAPTSQNRPLPITPSEVR